MQGISLAHVVREARQPAVDLCRFCAVQVVGDGDGDDAPTLPEHVMSGMGSQGM